MDPRARDAFMGPVINRAAVETFKDAAKSAEKKGKIFFGGSVLDKGLFGRGYYVEPTVAIDLPSGHRLFREELFIPFMVVDEFKTLDEALEKANDTEYGLSSAVFGRDIARAVEVAKRIDSGMCHVNGPTVHDEAQMPFGGVKASGYGRFGGKAAVNEFTELRWITIQTTPRHYPF